MDLDRGGAAHYTSTLSATDPGVWEGPEDAHTYDCPNDDVGESTGDHKIEVTRSKHHHATRIGGTTEIHISGCGATPSFINYKLKGKLKD